MFFVNLKTVMSADVELRVPACCVHFGPLLLMAGLGGGGIEGPTLNGREGDDLNKPPRKLMVSLVGEVEVQGSQCAMQQ